MPKQHKSLAMDWLGLESRLREILRETEVGSRTGGAAWKDGIRRIDAAIAAYTGRGNALREPDDPRARALEDAEWQRLEGR